MSVSKFIICENCKKSLWIGQSSHTFYSGEPHTMAALGEFFFNHRTVDGYGKEDQDHVLRFVDEFYKDYRPWDEENGWEEIDADDYKAPPDRTDPK